MGVVVMTVADLRPGDIGFGPIDGAAGLLVSAGQLMLGEGFTAGPLSIRHVFIVVDSTHVVDIGPEVTCVEAMPSGARRHLINDRWTNRFAYVRLVEDYPGQANDAAAIARAMIGTPYSFASYAALAAWRFGWKTPRLERWINRRKPPITAGAWERSTRGLEPLALPCEAICSVLVDQAWSLAGKSIMQGVAHQCVTPGALAGRLLTHPDARWIWPGETADA
jgi:hypothetical protein